MTRECSIESNCPSIASLWTLEQEVLSRSSIAGFAKDVGEQIKTGYGKELGLYCTRCKQPQDHIPIIHITQADPYRSSINGRKGFLYESDTMEVQLGTASGLHIRFVIY